MPESRLYHRRTVLLCLANTALLFAGIAASAQDGPADQVRPRLTQNGPANAVSADSKKSSEPTANKESTDPAFWLALARQQIDQGTDHTDSATAWAIVAAASQQLGDRQGYRQCMDKAVSQMKAQSVLNPAAGVNTMLQLAATQEQCDDKEAAQASVREAADLSDGLPAPAVRAANLARCAGCLARMGDSAGWAKYWNASRQNAEKVGTPNSDDRLRQPYYVEIVAYGEALDAARALAAAQNFERRFCPPNSPTEPQWMASGYARVVHAAAMRQERGETQQDVLDQAYLAGSMNLVCLLDPYGMQALVARRLMVEADTAMAAWERAWVGMVNLPDPKLRTDMICGMFCKRVKLGQYREAIQLAEKLPAQPLPINALRWIAEAQTALGAKSLSELKRWAEQQGTSSERAAALAGIAAGLTRRGEQAANQKEPGTDSTPLPHAPNDRSLAELQRLIGLADPDALGAAVALIRKNPSEQTLRDVVDSNPRAVRKWALQQAELLAAKEMQPEIRAFVCQETARVYNGVGNQSAYRTAVRGVNEAVIALWDRIAAGRPTPRLQFDNLYHWEDDFRVRKAEAATQISIMELLFQLESFQRAVDDKQGAWETLLLAMKSLDSFPRDRTYGSAGPTSLEGWTARVAGRLRLHGKIYLAETIMRAKPWFRKTTYDGDMNYLAGLASAEAEDLSGLQEYADKARTKARSGPANIYAADISACQAMLAARKGDTALFRQAATAAGGFLTDRRAAAASSVLLQLAEAAALIGEWDMAQQFVDQSNVTGPQRDGAVATLVCEMAKRGQLADARKLADRVHDPLAKARVTCALSNSDAAAPGAKFSSVLLQIDSLPSNAEKAAAFVGVAAAAMPK